MSWFIILNTQEQTEQYCLAIKDVRYVCMQMFWYAHPFHWFLELVS